MVAEELIACEVRNWIEVLAGFGNRLSFILALEACAALGFALIRYRLPPPYSTT